MGLGTRLRDSTTSNYAKQPDNRALLTEVADRLTQASGVELEWRLGMNPGAASFKRVGPAVRLPALSYWAASSASEPGPPTHFFARITSVQPAGMAVRLAAEWHIRNTNESGAAGLVDAYERQPHFLDLVTQCQPEDLELKLVGAEFSDLSPYETWDSFIVSHSASQELKPSLADTGEFPVWGISQSPGPEAMPLGPFTFEKPPSATQVLSTPIVAVGSPLSGEAIAVNAINSTIGLDEHLGEAQPNPAGGFPSRSGNGAVPPQSSDPLGNGHDWGRVPHRELLANGLLAVLIMLLCYSGYKCASMMSYLPVSADHRFFTGFAKSALSIVLLLSHTCLGHASRRLEAIYAAVTLYTISVASWGATLTGAPSLPYPVVWIGFALIDVLVYGLEEVWHKLQGTPPPGPLQ
jgi:hypothetical protein